MSQRFERIRTAFLLSLGLCLITAPGASGAELLDVTTVTAGTTATVQDAAGSAQRAVSLQQEETGGTATTAAVLATAPSSINTTTLDTTTLSQAARSVTRPAARTVSTLQTAAGKVNPPGGPVVEALPRAVKRVHLDRKPIGSTTDRAAGSPTQRRAERPMERPTVRSDVNGSGATRSQGSGNRRPHGRSDRRAWTGPAEATTMLPAPAAAGAAVGHITGGGQGIDLSVPTASSATHVERRLGSAGAPVDHVPGPAPPVALPALAGAAFSSMLLMSDVLGLIAIFTFAAPGMGRATRLRAAPWRPLGFASPLEQPG